MEQFGVKYSFIWCESGLLLLFRGMKTGVERGSRDDATGASR